MRTKLQVQTEGQPTASMTTDPYKYLGYLQKNRIKTQNYQRSTDKQVKKSFDSKTGTKFV